MSVLIKGMDMPTDCTDCPLKIYKCDLWKDLKATDYYLHRHKDCPLVEVKTPHGDLIDVSKISSTVGYYTLAGGKTLKKRFYEIDYIQNAPTVIESEE